MARTTGKIRPSHRINACFFKCKSHEGPVSIEIKCDSLKITNRSGDIVSGNFDLEIKTSHRIIGSIIYIPISLKSDRNTEILEIDNIIVECDDTVKIVNVSFETSLTINTVIFIRYHTQPIIAAISTLNNTLILESLYDRDIRMGSMGYEIHNPGGIIDWSVVLNHLNSIKELSNYYYIDYDSNKEKDHTFIMYKRPTDPNIEQISAIISYQYNILQGREIILSYTNSKRTIKNQKYWNITFNQDDLNDCDPQLIRNKIMIGLELSKDLERSNNSNNVDDIIFYENKFSIVI